MTTDTTTPIAGTALTRAQLLGKRVDVLDKGWIELQDLMGDDLAIVNAARASFLGESKGTDRDKKLLFYLLQHRHTTPFEQVEFKFRVRAPVVTWWQWVRHRTWSFNAQCLAGDTEVIFDKPETREKGSLRVGSKVKIADLFRRWNTWERERLRHMELRMLNEDTMLLETARIGDVLHAGVKPGFRITTKDGRHITCSADHRFLFEGGWQTLGEATGLEVVNGRAVCNSLPRLYVNGLVHRENLEAEFALQLRPGAPIDLSRKQQYHQEALRPNGHATPHLVAIERIEYVGEIEMFDLVVDGPYANFIANWFVVHNSGRYVAFEENDFYVPSAWRRQSPSNKQASLGELSDAEGQPLTDALVEHYERGYALYKQALEAGVAREQARMFLPGFAVYYTWVAKTDAHNLMHFLSLRMADEAQYEIRVYAQAIYEHFFKPALPWTAEAFEKFTLTQNS